MLQNGKCHQCKKIISIQYPLVELLIPVIFYFGFIRGWETPDYITFLFISSILITISIIDFKTFTIPLSLIICLMITESVFIYYNLESLKDMFLGFMFGVSYLGIPFVITSVIYKKQTLGYGDLLLVSLLGIWIGLINILLCIFIACVLGIFIWIGNRLWKNENVKLPFGTYLSMSAILLKILDINIPI